MKTEKLTASEFSKLVYNGNLPKEKYKTDLAKIKYFSFIDLGCSYGSKKYDDSLIFIVSYDEFHIYGVLKFAYFESDKHYSISYCSTNKDHLNKGVCYKIVNLFTSYFKQKYPDELLFISQYSVSGWKYLRPLLSNLCSQKNISFKDNIVGYMDEDGLYSDEYYKLRDLSIKLIGGSVY